LEQVNYPSGSGMANVAIGYTDFGGVQTVTDAAGTRTIVYDAYLQPAIERFDASSIYGEMALSTHNFNTIAQGQVTATFGRLARIALGTTTESESVYVARYGYDPDTHRLQTVEGPGLPTGEANYVYVPDTNLIQRIDFKDGGGTLL